MKNYIKKSLMLLLGILFLANTYFPTVVLAAKSSLTVDDLGVANPGLLPSNPFYFFKEWRRGLKRSLVFNDQKRANVELDIMNEQAAEMLKLSKILPNDEASLLVAVGNYELTLNILDLKSVDDKNIWQKFLKQTLIHFRLMLDLRGQYQSDRTALSFNRISDKITDLINFGLDNRLIDYNDIFYFLTNNSRLPLDNWLQFEVLVYLDDYLPPQKRGVVSRLKDYLAVDLVVWFESKSAANFNELINLPGDLLTRAQALDELRIKIGDFSVKNKLNIARQNIAGAIHNLINEDIAEKELSRVEDDFNRIFQDVDLLPAKDWLKQAQFYLDNGRTMLADKNWLSAFNQASNASASINQVILSSQADSQSYSLMIKFLKNDFDRFSEEADNKDSQLIILKEVEKDIIRLSDRLADIKKYPDLNWEREYLRVQILLKRWRWVR